MLPLTLLRRSACATYRQVRAKALGDELAVQSAIDFILQNFDDCMASAKSSDGLGGVTASENDALESNLVPACLEDDESPAVDLLLAVAKRQVYSTATDHGSCREYDTTNAGLTPRETRVHGAGVLFRQGHSVC